MTLLSICSQTNSRNVSVHICPIHRLWHWASIQAKQGFVSNKAAHNEILTVFKKCIFSCFPRKWLSISSLADFTILDRLTTVILSLGKDQTKPNQNKRTSFENTRCLLAALFTSDLSFVYLGCWQHTVWCMLQTMFTGLCHRRGGRENHYTALLFLQEQCQQSLGKVDLCLHEFLIQHITLWFARARR